jgi:hypothetical protein
VQGVRRVAGVAALALFSIAASSPAAATTQVEVALVWTAASGADVTGLGTSEVVVSPTEATTLTLDIQLHLSLSGVAPRLTYAGLSLEFDRAGNDELDVVSFEEIPWRSGPNARLDALTPRLFSTQESAPGVPGKLYGFALGTFGPGAPGNISLTFARVVFATRPSNLGPDASADVFSGYFSSAFDGFWATHLSCDDDGECKRSRTLPITNDVVFGSASVRAIPEPDAIGLVLLGLLAIAVSRRP